MYSNDDDAPRRVGLTGVGAYVAPRSPTNGYGCDSAFCMWPAELERGRSRLVGDVTRAGGLGRHAGRICRSLISLRLSCTLLSAPSGFLSIFPRIGSIQEFDRGRRCTASSVHPGWAKQISELSWPARGLGSVTSRCPRGLTTSQGWPLSRKHLSPSLPSIAVPTNDS